MIRVDHAHVSVKEKGKLDGWICGQELGKDTMATEKKLEANWDLGNGISLLLGPSYFPLDKHHPSVGIPVEVLAPLTDQSDGTDIVSGHKSI
jgi:hypothetical protein